MLHFGKSLVCNHHRTATSHLNHKSCSNIIHLNTKPPKTTDQSIHSICFLLFIVWFPFFCFFLVCFCRRNRCIEAIFSFLLKNNFKQFATIVFLLLLFCNYSLVLHISHLNIISLNFELFSFCFLEFSASFFQLIIFELHCKTDVIISMWLWFQFRYRRPSKQQKQMIKTCIMK